MPYTRVATCCYCGTGSVLPKKAVPGRISCPSCGAPLRRLGVAEPAPRAASRVTQAVPVPIAAPITPRRAKQRPSVVARLLDRLEDVIEDVIDEVFD